MHSEYLCMHNAYARAGHAPADSAQPRNPSNVPFPRSGWGLGTRASTVAMFFALSCGYHMTLIDFQYKEFTSIVTAIAVAPTQRERSIVLAVVAMKVGMYLHSNVNNSS